MRIRSRSPTPLTNFLEMLLIFAIPAGLTYTFGRMAKNQLQGWTIFGAMALLFGVGVVTAYWAEARPEPRAVPTCRSIKAAGNMEGKEIRFGVANSALFATVTTDASCGAVNSMHDSFTPLGGLVPLANIQLGEVIFGGVGAGLYGILIFVLLSVFIAGLMVGRTPEYLGKKIEAHEVKLAMLYCLIFPLIILGMSAWSAIYEKQAAEFAAANPAPAPPENSSRSAARAADARQLVRRLVAQQRRTARPERNAVRLHERHGQQRLGLCRSQCQHALVEHFAGHW